MATKLLQYIYRAIVIVGSMGSFEPMYSYAHNKPIVCPFIKQNEVYLTGQNLTKSCSWPLDFCYTFVKGLDLSMLKI